MRAPLENLPAQAARRPPRRKRRRWVGFFSKLVAWLLVIVLVAALFAGGLGWFVYSQRTRLVNQVLAGLPQPFKMKVESIEHQGLKKVEIKGFHFESAAGGSVSDVPVTRWLADPNGLAIGKLGTLELMAPTFTITEKDIVDFLARPQSKAREVRQAIPFIPPGAVASLSSLHVRDAVLEFSGPHMPGGSLHFDWLAREVKLDRSGRLRVGRQEFTLRGIRLQLPGSAHGHSNYFDLGEAKVVVDEMVISPEESRFKIDSVALKDIDFQLTPEVFHGIAGVLQRPPDPARLAAQLPRAVQGAAATAWSTASPAFLGQQAAVQAGKAARRQLRPFSWESGPVTIANGRFLLAGFGRDSPGELVLPDGRAAFDYRADSLGMSAEGRLRFGRQEVAARDVSLGFDGKPGRYAFRAGRAVAAPFALGGGLTLEDSAVEGADIHYTPEIREMFRRRSEVVLPEKPVPRAERKDPFLRLIRHGTVKDSHFRMSGFRAVAPQKPLPFLDFDLSGEVREFGFTKDGLRSTELQSAELKKARLSWFHADPWDPRRTFITADQLSFKGRSTDFFVGHQLEELIVSRMETNITPDALPWLLERPHLPADDPSQPLPEPEAQEKALDENGLPIVPFHIGLRFQNIQLDQAQVNLELPYRWWPQTRATISINTETTPAGDRQNRLVVESLFSAYPGAERTPLLSAGHVEAVISPDEFWRERKIRELHISNATAAMSESMVGRFSANPPPARPSVVLADIAPVQISEDDAWNVADFSIAGSRLSLENLVPGLPSVTLAIDSRVHDVPLTPGGFLGRTETQTVELSHINIRSPLNPIYPVAELPVVKLEFTLEGLLQRRIDRVQLVTPKIYVGEHLFWYVDFYRNRRKKDRLAEGKAGAPGQTAGKSWDFIRLEAKDGSLVLAPKGPVLFPQPFKFNCVTEMKSGKLDATFIIPKDNYDFEQIGLKLIGMSGQASFNLPIKEKDNNLVETLHVERMNFRKYRAEDVYLTITYDKQGIYANFGGKAYRGYVNGGFNVYLDEDYSWDAWVSGKALDTDPITRAVSRSYFHMATVVDGKIVGSGNIRELFQVAGNLKFTKPGDMTIFKLDELIAQMPPEWTELKKSMTRVGLEPLRRYSFNQGSMEFKAWGREGKVKLNLDGPMGKRNFDVVVHDYRKWKLGEEKAEKAE